MLRPLCAALILCAALTACGDGGPDGDAAVRATTTPTDNVPPPRAEPQPLAGGAMTVRLSTGATRILDYAGVRLSTTGAADGRGRELSFPITRGRLAVAPAAGEIELGGGLRISTRDDQVDVTALRVVPAQEVVTAVVEGRRVPLLRFKLRYPDALPAAGEPFTAMGTTSVVGDRALERLGAEFGVDILRDGLPLGSMKIIALVGPDRE